MLLMNTLRVVMAIMIMSSFDAADGTASDGLLLVALMMQVQVEMMVQKKRNRYQNGR